MRQLTIQTFIYYLIYSNTRKIFQKILPRMFLEAWFLLWFNMRFKAWFPLYVNVKKCETILLTEVHRNRNIFQKNIPHILSNLSHEVTWSWNQKFGISRSWDIFHYRMSKNMRKTYDVNILFKWNWTTKAENWQSFWK